MLSREFLDLVDHTLLKAEATREQVTALCAEARELQPASVCVNGLWVSHCVSELDGSDVPVCSVVGFPLGAMAAAAVAERGWQAVFAALESLKPGDLEKTIVIRNEPHSVVQAIVRQIAHYTWHVGQIVLLAKHVKTTRGEAWNYMTIPPGGSQAFNRAKGL